MVELVGPSRFGGWNPDGSPLGVPVDTALVQVSAVNQAQTGNTMDMFPTLMSDEFIATFGIVASQEIIRAQGGRHKIVSVTSNPRALEGKRTTFTVLNETHHWIATNKGHDMYKVIWGNTKKIAQSRYLAITNAYLPGEDSVAQRMRESWEHQQEGKALKTKFLYDSLEAHADTPLTVEALHAVLPKIRGDAVWLDVDQIAEAIQDTTVSPSHSRRMWLNQIVAAEDALHTPAIWDAMELDGPVLRPGDEIVLGFDGGKTDDATVLVALRLSDMFVTILHMQEKPDGPIGDGWEVNRDKVDSAVHHAFSTYKVKGFYADVALWESYIDDWAEQYGESLAVKATGTHAVAWDMRGSLKRSTMSHERLVDAIHNGRLVHDGDLALRRHVLNARRRENNFGLSFGKESRESSRKVDAYAALMLAYEALHDLRTRGGKKQARERTGFGMFF